MKEKFSIGSKREGAKELEIKVTKKKVFVFLVILFSLAYMFTLVLKDNVEEVFPDKMKIGCLNGSIEVVEAGKTVYCGDHYSVLQGKVKNYDKLVTLIEGEDE